MRCDDDDDFYDNKSEKKHAAHLGLICNDNGISDAYIVWSTSTSTTDHDADVDDQWRVKSADPQLASRINKTTINHKYNNSSYKPRSTAVHWHLQSLR